MQDTITLTPDIIQDLLTHTESVMTHVYWFQHHLNLQPNRKHIGSSINYADIKCRENEFLRELINTIANWVYSKARSRNLFDERLRVVNNDFQNAATFITTQAFSKFRPGHPQGQFGELLLFNFVQHFFKAAPLLRKMRITTSTGHERFGSDALHVKLDGDKTIFLLGESKCYESKYQFNAAFSASLNSIINSFNSFDDELDLYTYEDFLEPELEAVAMNYKQGKLKGVHFELVCLVAYNETKIITGHNEDDIRASMQATIVERCRTIDSNLFKKFDERILDRINYIIFPIWNLDSLLSNFSKLIGGGKNDHGTR